MATVRMKKGNRYADIFDSPETIAQARKEGYSIEETKKEPVNTVNSEPTETTDGSEKKQRGKKNTQ